MKMAEKLKKKQKKKTTGKRKKGKLADDIRYHSDIKIHVKDFVAEVQTSRFGGGKPYVIWEQGMRERELKLIKAGK